MNQPASKKQLEEVWQEDDGLKDEEFDPRTFFFLHGEITYCQLDVCGCSGFMYMYSAAQRQLNNRTRVARVSHALDTRVQVALKIRAIVFARKHSRRPPSPRTTNGSNVIAKCINAVVCTGPRCIRSVRGLFVSGRRR